MRWVYGPDLTRRKDDMPWMWEDIGSPSGYLMAHERLMGYMGRSFIGPPDVETRIEYSGSWVCMGRDVKVGENVRLERCVVWPNAIIKAGSRYKNAVITPYGVLGG